MELHLLQQKLNIIFNDQNLLKQAFIHSSYINEHQLSQTDDNERLEFLGDAVLELAVSDYLYDQLPAMSEGEMTKIRAFLVRESTLSSVAVKLEFGNFLLLGKGEENTGGRERPSILADVFEAFLGALYVDQGFDHVCAFLTQYLYVYVGKPTDYKTTLQELIQQESGKTVSYTIIEEKGPAHDRVFVAQVQINDYLTTTGIGRSKKIAEQQAAREAIHKLRENK